MYTFLYSMILDHISLQNYFEDFSKFKNCPIMFSVSGLTVDRAGRPVHSRPDRSTGQVDWALRSGRACIVHVCRSTGRSTDWNHFALCFLSVDRQFKMNFFLWLPVDRVQRLVCQLDCRSTDSRLQPPTASFQRFSLGICLRFWCQLFLKICGLFSDLLS